MFNCFTRLTNLFSAGFSYSLSLLTARVTGRWMPVAAGIELTNLCNLKCPECLAGSGLMTRPSGFMTIPLFRKITDEIRPFVYNLNLYFQGEPMMHPQFFEILEIARGFNTVVSTNGHFLSPENSEKLALSGLGRLIISLDGMDSKTYSSYRIKGDFDAVTSGIENIVKAVRQTGSGMLLELQFLVNRFNENQIGEARRFARSMKVPLRLKSMQLIHEENIEGWLPEKKRYRRYEYDGRSYKIRSSLPNRCLRLWIIPVVTWDGKVVPCCFDKNAEHIMGNLNESSFRDIWRSEKYNRFREKVLRNRKEILICRNCTSGLNEI